MKFISEADKEACEAERALTEATNEKLLAARAGNMAGVRAAQVKFDKAVNRLAQARSKPVVAECFEGGEAFDPEESIELVIAAIVRRKRGEIPEVERFEKGEELHMIWCLGCADEAGVESYLKKR